jgi:hypothetical protein
MKNITLLLTLSAASAFAQGPLDPPSGGPAPAMKTLDQVEARTPIPKTSGSPIAGPHFTISQPGSYYLTGNITVASGDAIVISSDDVSLDLNGFTLKSTLSGIAAGSAVLISGTRTRLTIKNSQIFSGTIVPVSVNASPSPAGFEYGIYSDVAPNTQAIASDIHVTGTGSTGITLSGQSIIQRCTASQCGFQGLNGAIIRESNAMKCYSTAIRGANVSYCTGSSITGAGIFCINNISNSHGECSSGIGLVCNGNATNCTGTGNSDYGIYALGTASFCRVKRTGNGSIALYAPITIGCTVDADGGSDTIDSPQKYLGTP